MNKKRLLILGGTTEAREVAEAAAERLGALAVIITSLAGRTTSAPTLADPKTSSEVRIGGFGGVAGLTRFIRDEDIAAVVDATHPFAAQISKNAKAACDETKTPRLYLNRPHWTAPDGIIIETAQTFSEAAALAQKKATRCFLTIGSKGLEDFAEVKDVFFLIRTIEATAPPFENAENLVQRPPFTEADEKALMEKHAIDMLVTKESGGRATEAKIKAAAGLGIPVVMIERPSPPESLSVNTVDGALQWMADQIG